MGPGGARPHPSRRSRARSPGGPSPLTVAHRPGRLRAATATTAAAAALALLAGPAPAGAAGRLTISPAPGTPGRVAADADQRPRRPPRAHRAPCGSSAPRAARTPAACAPTRASGARASSPPRRSPRRARPRWSSASAAAHRCASSFTVARPGATPPVLNLTATQPDKLQHFVSEPGLAPPRITVHRDPGGTRGAILLTPLPSPVVHPGSTQHGDDLARRARRPDDRRRPRRASSGSGSSRRPTSPRTCASSAIEGRPVLTWWQGPVTRGRLRPRRGRDRRPLLPHDQDRPRRQRLPDGPPRVRAHAGRRRAVHDLLAGAGAPARARRRARSRRCSTRSSRRSTSRTGLVVWEWHALRPHPAGGAPTPRPANSASYDAFHINSIQALPGGRVLISARDTSAIYEVDRATGRDPVDARRQGERLPARPRRPLLVPARRAACCRTGAISMFDDEAGPPHEGAVLARARPAARPAPAHARRWCASYRRARGHLRPERGQRADAARRQRLRRLRRRRRSSRSSRRGGRLLFDAQPARRTTAATASYRFPWSATPATRPGVAARSAPAPSTRRRSSRAGTGPPTVARWQVLAGPDARLARARRDRRRGAASRPGSTSRTTAAPASRCARSARADACSRPPRRWQRRDGAGVRAPTAWPGARPAPGRRRALARRRARAALGAALRRRAGPPRPRRALLRLRRPRAARWPSLDLGRAAARPRRPARPAAGRPARHRRATPRSSSSAATRSPTRGAWRARVRARRSPATSPSTPGDTAFLAEWVAAAPPGPGARRASASTRCDGCGSTPTGRSTEAAFAALWREQLGGEPPPPDAPARVRRNERRMRRRGPYDTPAAVGARAVVLRPRPRSAQIGAPPRRARLDGAA